MDVQKFRQNTFLSKTTFIGGVNYQNHLERLIYGHTMKTF